MKRTLGFALAVTLAGAPAWAQTPPTPAKPPAPVSASTRQRHTDTQVGTALRHVLGVLMQNYGDLMGKIPQSLNDADIAMRQAEQALDAGDDTTAAAAIQKAIEALQKSGQSMSQQMAAQFGSQDGQDQGDGQDGQDGQMSGQQDGNQPGDQDGNGPGWGRQYGRDGRWNGRGGPPDRRADQRRDPLGRPLRDDGTGQSPDENGVKVPDKMEKARSAEIQNELRKREAEKTRPQPELDYIDRLLKQF